MIRPRALALALLALLAFSPALSARDEARLQAAQRQLEAGEPEAALELVEELLEKRKPSGEALLVASTARIMLGQTRQGEEDLRRALELDPALKQGWLNLAAVEIASERYEAAYAALAEAQSLDPGDMENQLNLGTVRALAGRADEAAAHFARYLEALPGAESHYLVAGNYALGGFEALAVEHLRQAIRLDERVRLRVRSDNKFVLLESPAYRQLLATDVYRPPAGAHTAAAGFAVPYSREDGELLGAVLEAMQQLSEPYDPRVEATESWALVWGVMRIKITNQTNGTGVVRMSAPAERFDENEWRRRTEAIFRAVHSILNRPKLRLPG